MTDDGASSGSSAGLSSADRPLSQALAEVLVDELVRGGVREAVLSPGSRNAPLSFALHDADTAGRLRLHVRIDERTAGFLALGLSKASGLPVPVCCTSGTAVANLHPGMVEAGESGVGVIALTADRPAHLRGTGANQTIDQVGVFGSAVVMAHDLPAPATATAADNAAWRSLVCRALAAAGRGPVHLNVQLADPLAPAAAPGPIAAALVGRADGSAWTARRTSTAAVRVGVRLPEPGGAEDPTWARTLVVVAGPGTATLHATWWAHAAGYPVLAEPTGWWGAPGGTVLAAGAVLLGSALSRLVPPSRVVVVGRPTLGRALGALIGSPGVHSVAVARDQTWVDPGHVVHEVAADVGDLSAPPVDESWRALWSVADRAARARLDEELEGDRGCHDQLTGPAVALAVRTAATADAESPGLLVVAASQAVRDLELAGPPRDSAALRVMANRGAAGIDGTLSTAVGAALHHQAAGGGRAFALVGDLAFVHDLNGLVIGPGEPRPDLTIVVADDDGGAIFSTLEYGLPEHAATFERIFGTPTGVDVPALCAGVGVPCVPAPDAPALTAALADPPPGLRVVYVRTDRTRRRQRDAALRAAVHAAVAHAVGDGTRPRGD